MGITFSAILWLLPGLGITFSVLELATGNVISGTVNMFKYHAISLTFVCRTLTDKVGDRCFLNLLTLGYGVIAGQRIAVWLVGAQHAVVKTRCTSSTSPYFQFMFLPVSIIMCVLLRANKRQFPLMILTALLTSNTYYMGTSNIATNLHISSEFATILASIVAAVSSNAIGRWTDENAFNPLVSLLFSFAWLFFFFWGSCRGLII